MYHIIKLKYFNTNKCLNNYLFITFKKLLFCIVVTIMFLR